ncbi:hypothetical protein FRC11_014558, partial [Ceratobasidium sp. 423]
VVISDQLKALRDILECLPPKHQSTSSTCPFENFTLDEEWLKLTRSAQGSVNHTLEVTFGSRHHGQPLVLTSHGPDLVAVVDVLSTHITGLNGENPILIQWIDDLQAAATHALEQDPSPDSVKHDRKPTAKQEILNQDASKKKNDKAKKATIKTQAKKAKKRMEEESLGAQIEALNVAKASGNATKSGDKSTQPSVYAPASAAGCNQCNLKFNYLVLQAFSIIDTPSWKRLIQFLDPLTQIQQHFQQEERLLEDSKVQKPHIAPTLRFHDMSDMFKSSGKGVNVVTATDSSAEDEDTEAPGLSAEEWEREAGFDEVIERVEAGSKDAFEVNGINLSDPFLLDLLSDEPIPGAITQGSTSAQKRSAPTDVGSLTAEGSRKKLAPESFQ